MSFLNASAYQESEVWKAAVACSAARLQRFANPKSTITGLSWEDIKMLARIEYIGFSCLTSINIGNCADNGNGNDPVGRTHQA